MNVPLPTPIAAARAMRCATFDPEALREALFKVTDYQLLPADDRRRMRARVHHLVECLEIESGTTTAERFASFEANTWTRWASGMDRWGGDTWTWGVRAAIVGRAMVPSWPLVSVARVNQWVERLPSGDPLIEARNRLIIAVKTLDYATVRTREQAVTIGLRLLVAHDYDELDQITEEDLVAVPRPAKGMNGLDAALCSLGVFNRTPLQGAARRLRTPRHSPAELVENSDIPERFRAVSVLYLETYSVRVSDVYPTLRHKQVALAHFWRFIDERFPEVRSSADVRPAHARAFIPHAIERARAVRRRPESDDRDRTTGHSWAIEVRSFFADLCSWATEEGSPLAPFAPPVVPMSRNDLRDVGFEQARRRSQARTAATIVDLSRELPNIRALALRAWNDAARAALARPTDAHLRAREDDAFWDWALLELLVQSGLRIEEACELTSLDVLKRRQSDGRVYYLLHVKPSKFDRARVIPIGDGLGRVIAEITRHVKRFYGTNHVPMCDRRDVHEKCAAPRAPYLLQGAKHPGPIGVTTIRGRLARLSTRAGARRADGEPLVLHPHDCRRAFASEHLNNNTPIHVIQALLGHASIDTVMVYAKLYPNQLVEEHRKAMRSAYIQFHGTESTRNPTLEEWTAFSASASLRDMGTHLCGLPTGEHCPKGLVCLGCSHAQPKKSAAPTFRQMLASHTRVLLSAKDRGEPPGQIAARELEVDRIRYALQRAEELASDVAEAIEASAELSAAP